MGKIISFVFILIALYIIIKLVEKILSGIGNGIVSVFWRLLPKKADSTLYGSDGYYFPRERRKQRKRMMALIDMACERAMWDDEYITTKGKEQRKKDRKYLAITDFLCRFFLPVLLVPSGFRQILAGRTADVKIDGYRNNRDGGPGRAGRVPGYGIMLPMLLLVLVLPTLYLDYDSHNIKGLVLEMDGLLRALFIFVDIIIVLKCLGAVADFFLSELTERTLKADVIRRFPCEEGYILPEYTVKRLLAARARIVSPKWTQNSRADISLACDNPLRYGAGEREAERYRLMWRYDRYGEKGYFGKIRASDILPDDPVEITDNQYTDDSQNTQMWINFTTPRTVKQLDENFENRLSQDSWSRYSVQDKVQIIREYYARRDVIVDAQEKNTGGKSIYDKDVRHRKPYQI